jgi:hypothetical protein
MTPMTVSENFVIINYDDIFLEVGLCLTKHWANAIYRLLRQLSPVLQAKEVIVWY